MMEEIFRLTNQNQGMEDRHMQSVNDITNCYKKAKHQSNSRREYLYRRWMRQVD